MSTTISDIVTSVKDQLKLAGATGSPSDPNITRFIIRAYQELTIAAPPIKGETGTVAGTGHTNRSATVTTLEVMHVGKGAEIFVPGAEWNQTGATVYLTTGAAVAGDTVWLYGRADLGISLASATILDDLLFGDNYYQAAATLRATMLALLQMTRVGATAAPNAGAAYKSIESAYEAMVQQMVRRYEDWRTEMQNRVNAAIQLGTPPLVQHPYARMRNRSVRVNRLIR